MELQVQDTINATTNFAVFLLFQSVDKEIKTKCSTKNKLMFTKNFLNTIKKIKVKFGQYHVTKISVFVFF